MNTENPTPEDRQLRMMKVQTWMIGLILVIILALALFLMFKVNSVVGMVEGLNLEQLDLQQINATVQSLQTAAENLGEMDMEALNGAIQGFSETAGNLSELDFEKLNGFMDSLEELGKQMDAVSGFFKNFLKR